MFNTFADVFGVDESDVKTNGNETITINGSRNPFDLPSTTDIHATVDPFGISYDLKLSASSQRFDDSPFVVETSKTDPSVDSNESIRPRSGKAALSSPNWVAYQHSIDEPNLGLGSASSTVKAPPTPVELTFDPFEQPGEKLSLLSNLSVGTGNLAHSKSINLINPFSDPTISKQSIETTNAAAPVQISPIDLLFDLNVDPSALPSNTHASLDSSNQVQSSYDLLGLNRSTTQLASGSVPSVKVLKSDSLTDIPKKAQTANTSTSSLLAKSAISSAASCHTLTQQTGNNVPAASPSSLRLQATALSLLPGATASPSATPYDDKFLDWLTKSDDLMCEIDPKLSGLSKKMDINMMKSTEDLLGSINRPIPNLSTLKESANEQVSSPPAIPIRVPRRPSDEELPSILIHEPTNEHNDSNVVPQDYFDNTKPKFVEKKKNEESDEDDDEESKQMVFTIDEKKATSVSSVNIPVPLLPPPPSPSTVKKDSKQGQAASDEASSSSSPSDDENDPLAMFRSKSLKKKKNTPANQKPPVSLMTGWMDEEEEKAPEGERVKSLPPPPPSPPEVDYYLHEPDYDDSLPLEPYHNDINELQLQQLNGWLLQVRVPLRQKDLYKSTFQRFSETRSWQECYVRIFFEEKKLRFYLPQTIEQSFAEIELETWYQCTKFNLQQLDQYTKIHTFKIFEANYREIPQVRMDRLATLPEKLLRKFTRPNKAQQVLLDHANCVQQEIVKFGHMNYGYLKKFSIIFDDLFWSMPVVRSRLQKHVKEEVTVKIVDEYEAHMDKYRHIIKHKSRTRIFVLTFLNGYTPTLEIGINDWFRHGKEVNKRNEIIINKTLQEYWIKPEQVEMASILDKNEYENNHLLKLIPPDSQKIEILRFRTRPKQNLELPLHAYCFMSVLDRQVAIRIEVMVSNAFNVSLLSKAASYATSDKTSNVREDNSDEQCPCQNIQIRFPIPDAWVYMFRVEKRFRYGAIHSVRRKAGKIKGLDRFMIHRGDTSTPMMAASTGVAKYEQAFRSIVWRIDQLPKRDQGAYKTHIFECKMSIPSHDPIPEKFDPTTEVEFTMTQAFISHCQVRSVAVPEAEETPEKWIRPKTHFSYTVDIEYAFKEEETKEFAPAELDLKEQSMSQSETENNSRSDESD